MIESARSGGNDSHESDPACQRGRIARCTLRSVAGPGVVELARAAVRRLAEAQPTAEAAREALHRIERVGAGPPYTVAIAGDHAARTALLNCLAGEHLFDPTRHDPGRVLVTLRRGSTTALRARRRDGSVEERTLGAPGRRATAEDVVAEGSDPAVRSAAEPAPLAPCARGSIVQPAEVGPTAMVRRPPWWAVWRWLLVWVRAWRAPRAPASGPTVASPAPAGPAVMAPGTAPSATPAPERSVPDRSPPGRAAARGKRVVDPRRQFVDTLRACFADDAVERLFVEAGEGPLPEKVVVIELPSRANAMSLEAVGADACLVACGEQGFAMTEQLEAVLTVVPHLFAVGPTALPDGCDDRVRRLGAFAEAAPELVRLATIERSLAVGRRALGVLSTGCVAIDDAIAAAEAGFRKRIDRLEALRVASPDDYTAAVLASVRQTVLEHVHRGIRHAQGELDATIARCGAAWSARLGEATSTEALRAAAAQLDDESPGALQAAQAEAHRALVDDLTEHARAHYRELVSDLGPAAVRANAVPSWLTVEVAIGELGSGTSLGAVAPRLTSLFRSLDALRSDALAQLEQRIAKLRQRASANIVDLEPRLEPAVTGTLAIALRAEVERHGVWLEAELLRERVAVDVERAQLAVLASVRDTAGTDERELASALDALASELPRAAGAARGPRATRGPRGSRGQGR